MAIEPRRLPAKPGSELARLLDEAARSPLLVERDGVTYRITVESPHGKSVHDPQAAIAAMRAAAGSWKDIDAEAFKAQLYRAREEGTKREGARTC
jgi:acyl-CoA reductase-like NAD-dependent aldehyde dehydrogenase